MIIRGKRVLTWSEAMPILRRAKRWEEEEKRFYKKQKRELNVIANELSKIDRSLAALRNFVKLESSKYEHASPIQKHLEALMDCISGRDDRDFDRVVESLSRLYPKALHQLSKAQDAARHSKRKKKAPVTEVTEADFSGAHPTIEPPPEPIEVTDGDVEPGEPDGGTAADQIS